VTTGPAALFADSLLVKGKSLKGKYTHENGEPEVLVPVQWIQTVAIDEALVTKGLFANQNSACRLRDERTIKALYEFFNIGSID
jgi:hypothetical protein